MPMIMNTTSVAAGATNPNVITGSAFEFARTRQIVSLGTAQSATGMFVTLQSGAEIVAEEMEPPILTRYPIIPDEMYFSDVVEVGDRIIQRVRNPTGGTVVVRSALQYTPAG